MADRRKPPVVTCTVIESARTFDRSFIFNVAGVEYDLPEMVHHLSDFLDKEGRFQYLNRLIENPDKLIQIG